MVSIEDYDLAPDLPGAVANGRAWARWLSDERGVGVIKVIEDGDATREEVLAAARGLSEHVHPDARVWIVFIGHGAPTVAGHGVWVGADARQTAHSLEARSVALHEVADAIGTHAGEVVVVQDACFSGQSSAGDLVPGLAPLLPTTPQAAPGWTVLAAGRGDEYAGPLSDGSRPAFSYLVLGALMGWGDGDGDGWVSASEAVDWSARALFQTTTGRTQRPELVGADVRLGRAGRERAPDLVGLAQGTVVSAAPTPASPPAEISLGAESDLAALAHDAEVKRAAAAQAETLRLEAEAAAMRLARAKAEERRRKLDAAKAAVREAAAADFETIAPLVRNPTPEGRRALEAYLRRYGKAEVRVDGVSEPVSLREVDRVRAALDRLKKPPREPMDPAQVRASAGYSGAGLLSVGGLVLITQAQVTRGSIRTGLEQSTMSLSQAESLRTDANRTLALGYLSLGAGVALGARTRASMTASTAVGSGSIVLSGAW